MEFFSAFFYFVYYKKPLVIRSLLEGKGSDVLLLLFSYFIMITFVQALGDLSVKEGSVKKKAR
jgi:hypothetical protein